MKLGLLLAVALPIAAQPASALELKGAMKQGGLVYGQTEADAHVVVDGRELRVAPDGRFIVGFGRDAPARARIEIARPGALKTELVIGIARQHYDIQRIDGLPSQQVTPDRALLDRIRGEADEVKAARFTNSFASFPERFAWPVTGPISGVYGSQRILNGEPRQPHFGVDIAADAGAPVGAAADGIVTLAERDFFLTGGTIVIDHGYGLSTTYAHLATVEVAPGQQVALGERIGVVGATGRVTGPHLHWGADWYDVRLDPALLAGPMPQLHAAH